VGVKQRTGARGTCSVSQPWSPADVSLHSGHLVGVITFQVATRCNRLAIALQVAARATGCSNLSFDPPLCDVRVVGSLRPPYIVEVGVGPVAAATVTWDTGRCSIRQVGHRLQVAARATGIMHIKHMYMYHHYDSIGWRDSLQPPVYV
jgi:hypothetical protein